MKNKFIALIFLALLSSFTSSAQDVYQRGYVIKNNGDTLKGWIFENTDKNLFNAIQFKNSFDDKIPITYTVDDISEFKFDYGRFFIRFDISEAYAAGESDTGIVFLKQVVSGPMEMYVEKVHNQPEHIFLHNDSLSLINLPIPMTLKSSSSNDLIRTNRHIGILKLVLTDCNDESLLKKVNYRSASISKIIKKYNDCAFPSLNSEIYKNRLKVNAEIQIGLIYRIRGADYTEYQPGFRVALFANISLPESLGSKLSYRPGISFTYTDYEQTNVALDGTTMNYSILPGVFRLSFKNTGLMQPYIDFGGGISWQSNIERYKSGYNNTYGGLMPAIYFSR